MTEDTEKRVVPAPAAPLSVAEALQLFDEPPTEQERLRFEANITALISTVRDEERAKYEALAVGWCLRLATIALTMPGNSGLTALDLSDEIRAALRQQGGQ